MARSAANDRQYLEQHRGKWRVSVAVPRALQARLGASRLKHPLNTDSLTIANQLKWPIVNEMRARIAEAAAAEGIGDLRSIAVEFHRQRQRAVTDRELDAIDAGIGVTIDAVLGKPIGIDVDPITGEEEPLFEPGKVKQAQRFAKMVAGKATPFDELHGQYMAQLQVKPRTKADDERAIKLLKRWCDEKDVEPFLQSFPSKKAAVRFVDDLQGMEPKLSPVTLNKYINRLSRFWQWLEKREEVPMDVWRGLSLAPPPVAHDEKERPFTDEEMVKLLDGDTTQAMHDLMRIAALTGCRLDPIVCLRVKDCLKEGVFVFKPQKKEKAERLCPIHPDLHEIVERRVRDKKPDDPFFPEWPGPQKAETKRERSFKTSNQFTAYARSIGVREELDGRRRSLINFHSFRRWFITKAERAGQPESIIAAVVGHKRHGMTLGLYSAGPAIEQARACVEAVKLPSSETATE
ncbi:Phage integrase [Neorhizobium galegae bv. officinalis bv. officinalis str. HAMBI 1141]|uniref:Phage integrase n=1 Tax=Neorhizobium galegae bv. officinalis bv. officinalis str. HAMBI 1141 TaxID=1028801 RepID=A0A068TDM0_NEOGA|nr:tyrosine-type recombinase/integrase [Neorhizobium galegae]CDN56513.1 Phage integrase [Neorhizobium galegae bv. officinalis bv. officinalis str. HAMBI 1141]